MKRIDSMVREYVRSLNDDEFRYLYIRYTQNICGDLAEVADFLSRDKEIDRWLASAISSNEWFEMIDTIGDIVKREGKKRVDSPSAPAPKKEFAET